MKKYLLLVALMFFQYFAFCEISEYKADLNFDGIEDVLIEDSEYEYDLEKDVLRFNIKVIIKLLNNDGSLNREIIFNDNRNFNESESDGSLSYYIENNMIVRDLIIGKHSYKNYINAFFIYDKETDNWKLSKKTIHKSPLHEDKIEDIKYETENIYLYDKETLRYSGPKK